MTSTIARIAHAGRGEQASPSKPLSIGDFDLKKERLFWSKVMIVGTCWEWTAAKTTKGYGAFRIGDNQTRAHRISWVYFKGPIPDGMQVLHHCDNRSCVNPHHLFLGTNQDNCNDKVAKGRQQKGPTNPQTVIPFEVIQQIRHARKSTGLGVKSLALQFGVSIRYVRELLKGLYRVSC